VGPAPHLPPARDPAAEAHVLTGPAQAAVRADKPSVPQPVPAVPGPGRAADPAGSLEPPVPGPPARPGVRSGPGTPGGEPAAPGRERRLPPGAHGLDPGPVQLVTVPAPGPCRRRPGNRPPGPAHPAGTPACGLAAECLARTACTRVSGRPGAAPGRGPRQTAPADRAARAGDKPGTPVTAAEPGGRARQAAVPSHPGSPRAGSAAGTAGPGTASAAAPGGRAEQAAAGTR
jgi:hypothetical protein